MIRRAKQLNNSSVIVVCGCYVEVAKKEVESLKEVDLIIEDKEKINIVQLVENFILNRNKEKIDILKSAEETLSDFVEYGTVSFTEKNRAVVKIQDGCNMFCTYCIIPYARGRIRSRKVYNIVEEIKEIAKKGIKEIVLTGIHIASYGKDWEEENIRLIDLLEEINLIDGIERIRLGSLEPTIITEAFLERLSKLEKICHHFHLSLQSGCNSTLKRMNRKYTVEEFEIVCEMIRKVYPDANLTTDIIVGFPGETEKEFNDTYKFLKKIKFYKMHVFKYSPRNGTVAAKMANQIDGTVKEERSNKLIELSDHNQICYQEKYLGKNIDVLFEETESGYTKGHTSNYMEVKVKGEKAELIDQIKSVELVEIDKKNIELIGSIVIK